jgi:hypothetical protein
MKDKSIFIKNIYYMLSYAFTTLDQGGYEDIAKESFDHIHNLFAAILAKGIGRQLKQGLYREYVNHIEEAPVIRGKINMPGTIQNRLARKQVVTCEYDELSENNLLNQICHYKAPGNLIASIMMSFSSFGYYGQIWFNRDYTYECAAEEMPAGYADSLMQCSPAWAFPAVIIAGIVLSAVMYGIAAKLFRFKD